MDNTATLDAKIVDFIARGLGHDDEIRFNELALQVFALQYANIAPYREYCNGKGVSPGNIDDWRLIPAVPSAAFRSHALASFPLERAVQSNLTSGTTGRKNRGKVYRDQGALDLIMQANGMLTRGYLFPDVERMKIMLMVPSPKMAPSMGMAIGLEQVRKQFGTPESAFLISPLGLDVNALLRAIRQAEVSGEPLALIGATSCFIYFFQACRQEDIRFRLPPGSRICDGGGYVGQFGEWTKEEFVAACTRVFSVPASHCVNVLGMAESSTNYFDNVLRNHLAGKMAPRGKESPPWTRTLVVHPETLQPLPVGEIGLLRHYDLTNRAMILGVQTDNVGVATAQGFDILGRWSKDKGGHVITYSGGMPSSKIFTTLTDYLMNRRITNLAGKYEKAKKGLQP